MAEALQEVGFEVRAEPLDHENVEEAYRAFCCDEEVSHDSDIGGIFGPYRIYCETCGREVVRREVDDYEPKLESTLAGGKDQ
jgi:hypothetical protein